MITTIELLPSISLGELRRRVANLPDDATVELHRTSLLVGSEPVVDPSTYDEFFQRIAGNDVLEGGKV